MNDAQEPDRLAARGLDVTVPNVARIYDYILGGKDNFDADRAAAARLLAVIPGGSGPARMNRAFLGRVVRFLAAERGIRQFLDIGSGLPTAANVHEIAQAADPDARVVYVDSDPSVVLHAQAILQDRAKGVAAVRGDLRDPAGITASPAVRELIDSSVTGPSPTPVAPRCTSTAGSPSNRPRYRRRTGFTLPAGRLDGLVGVTCRVDRRGSLGKRVGSRHSRFFLFLGVPGGFLLKVVCSA